MRKKVASFGFTIVEIAVVLTISILLLTVASMNLTSSEKRSRDNERSADIEMMAQCLENNFLSTQEYFMTVSDMEKCPKSNEFMTPPKVLSPSVSRAYNNVTTTSGVSPLPTKDTYVFQPLNASGALCNSAATAPCTKYNLYYLNEYDNTVQKVSSTR